MTTLAERFQEVGEIALAHFRDSTILAFRTMTDGLAKQYRRDARKLLAFWENETDAEVWAQLTMIPDPENPGQSLADAWIADWQRLSTAVGETNANAA